MSTVSECKKQLLCAIRESKEMRRFETARDALKNHDAEREQIDAFRKRVFLLQNSNESIDMLDEMTGLFQVREELHENPLVGEYLDAELDLCRMLQRISMDVMNITDLELDSFSDIIPV